MAVDSRHIPDPAGPDAQQTTDFPIREGVEEIVRDLNRRGGLLGHRLTVAHGNDQCDGEEAVAVAKRAIAMKVSVVVGHSCSSAAIRASAVYAEAGVVMIATGVRHPRLTAPSGRRGIYRLAGRDDRQAESIAQLLASKFPGARTVVVHDESLQARGMADEIRRSLVSANTPPLLIVSYPAGKRDYATTVAQIVAAKPDVVLFTGQPMEASIILDQVQSTGFRVATAIGTDVLAGEAPPARLLAATNAFLVMLPWPGLRDGPVSGGASGFVREAQDTTRSAAEGLLGGAALELWAHAVARAGDVVDGVTLALRQPSPGRAGRIYFDDRGDAVVPSFLPHVWRAGRWQLRD
jgi:branched-chain amino acid transport system substrate-binding protein